MGSLSYLVQMTDAGSVPRSTTIIYLATLERDAPCGRLLPSKTVPDSHVFRTRFGRDNLHLIPINKARNRIAWVWFAYELHILAVLIYSYLASFQQRTQFFINVT